MLALSLNHASTKGNNFLGTQGAQELWHWYWCLWDHSSTRGGSNLGPVLGSLVGGRGCRSRAGRRGALSLFGDLCWHNFHCESIAFWLFFQFVPASHQTISGGVDTSELSCPGSNDGHQSRSIYRPGLGVQSARDVTV